MNGTRTRRRVIRASARSAGPTAEAAPPVPAWPALGPVGGVPDDAPAVPAPDAVPDAAPHAVPEPRSRLLGRLARRPRGVLARRPALVAAAVVALGLGVAVGAGYDALREPPPPTAAAQAAPSADPQACAVAQVAWSRAAAAHAGMAQDQPATVRNGYVDAQAVLAGVEPPPAVAADWATYVTYVDTVAAAVAAVTDDAAVADAAAQALGTVDADAVMTAAERITTYLNAGCRTTP